MSLPLQSIRVLDLTKLLPGPYCTMMLADFGAEVIKVEDPENYDQARLFGMKVDEDSAFFHSLNRNKKSVCLNLKSERGKSLFVKMVEKADVVVESFRPNVMDRLGLGYEQLKKVNPGLVYCSITGYGQSGPYAHQPGHDINYLSISGMLHLMGVRRGNPMVPAVQIADLGGGALLGAIGILLALYARKQSGYGQIVDISMLDGVISWLQTILPDYLVTNVLPERGELALSGGRACYELYKTKDSRWLSVGAIEQKFWQVFCQTIGRSDFIPLLDAPLKEQYLLKDEIQKIISEKNLAEWLETFTGIEACVSPVLTFDEVVTNPQIVERGMIRTVEHPSFGAMRLIGIPIKLSETPGSIRNFAPKLGEHTDEILTGLE